MKCRYCKKKARTLVSWMVTDSFRDPHVYVCKGHFVKGLKFIRDLVKTGIKIIKIQGL